MEVKIGTAKVRFATLEDVVIHKIIAGRPRDLEDVHSMLLRNPGCDSTYIETVLAEFDRALEEDYLSHFRELLKEAAG